MSNSQLAEKLKGLAILSDVPEGYLEKLAPLCEEVSFGANDTIFKQNDEAIDVFLILEGEVSLVICNSKVACRRIGTVGPGQMVGWSPLVERRLLSDSAHTVDEVTALRINGEKLLDFCRSDPEFGFEFMRRTALTIAERLNDTRRKLLQVHGVHLPPVQIESD